jgi:hypothetical protein
VETPRAIVVLLKKNKKNNDTYRKSLTKIFEKGYTKDFIYQVNRILTITDKINDYQGKLKSNLNLIKSICEGI